MEKPNKPLFAAALSQSTSSRSSGSSSKDSHSLPWTNVGSSFKPSRAPLSTSDKPGPTGHSASSYYSSSSSSSSRSSSKRHNIHSSNDKCISKSKQGDHKTSCSDKSAASSRSEISKKIFREETGLPYEAAFRVDRNLDGNNLAFDSLYRLHVPLYNKKDCLNYCRQNESKEKKEKRKYTRYYLKSTSEPIVKKINVIKEKSEDSKIPEYLPLSYSDQEDTNDSEEKSPSVLFHSFNYSQEQIKTRVSREQQLYNETQEFNEFLRKNPHDVDKWLAFVSFQDRIFDRSMDKNENLTASLIEKKLSILEKAIGANPKSIELLIERLNLVKFVWEGEKVNNEWKKLSFLYANNCRVWKEYIHFLQSSTSFFSTCKVISVYCKLFQTMAKILQGTFYTHKADESLQLDLVQVFSSYCTFLLDTGYTERSIASWQAIMEFNLFTLASTYETNELTAFFEPFWDSGAPRIGEPGALGWRQTMKLPHPSNCPSVQSKQDSIEEIERQITLQSKSPSQLWLSMEKVRQAYFWLPVRGSALESLEDTYQSVLFDDIKCCLFQFTSEEAKKALIESFFKHLFHLDVTSDTSHFHPHFSHSDADDHEEHLQFILSAIDLISSVEPKYKDLLLQSYCRHLYSTCKNDERQMVLCRKKLTFILSRSSLSNVLTCLIYLYLGKIEATIRTSTSASESTEDRELPARSVEQIGANYSDEGFINCLASHISDTTATLPLVAEYCLMKLGIKEVNDFDVQRREKLLVNAPPPDHSAEQAVKKLIVASVMQSREYLSCSFVPSAPLILKTSRKLSELSSGAFLPGILCWAVFTLVTKGHSQCDSIVQECLTRVTEEDKESLVVFRVRIYLHESQFAFGPLIQLRQLLRESVIQYPTNSDLFNLLVQVESCFAGVATCTGHFFANSSRNGAIIRHENYWLAYVTFEWNRVRKFNQSFIGGK